MEPLGHRHDCLSVDASNRSHDEPPRASAVEAVETPQLLDIVSWTSDEDGSVAVLEATSERTSDGRPTSDVLEALRLVAGGLFDSARGRISAQIRGCESLTLPKGRLPQRYTVRAFPRRGAAGQPAADFELLDESYATLAEARGVEFLVGDAEDRRISDDLVQILASATGHSPAEIDIESSLLDLGVDSVSGLDIRERVRQTFAVEIGMDVLLRSGSIEALAEHIRGGQEQTSLADGVSMVEPDVESRHLPFDLNDIQYAYLVGRSDAVEWVSMATHFYFEFDGALDPARVDAAWRRVIERHDVLRVVFLPSGQQRILEQAPDFAITVQDLRGADATAVEHALAKTKSELSSRAPSVDTWPHFEVVLSLLDGGATRLHVNVDMMIADLFSMGVIFRDWGAFYREPGVELAPLTLSYRDYLAAEKRVRGSERAARAQAYWDARLDSLPPAPVLPLAEHVDPEVLRKPRCGHRALRLDASVWTAIKAGAQVHGITPAMAVCAAFSSVLAHWARNPDFCINVTQFRRYPVHADVPRLAGDFTSTNLLEVHVRDAQPFSELASALAEQMWRDLEHADVGGVEVLSNLTRRRAERVLMPVVFTSGMDDLEPASDWAGTLGCLEGETSQVLLDCHIHEYAGGLDVVWDVIEEAFPAGLLTMMFDALSSTLQRLATDSEAWRTPALGDVRRAQWDFVRQYNDTESAIEPDLLHSKALQALRDAPHRPAVILPDETLSYEALFSRVANVAAALRDRGVVPGDRVGVVATPGWEGVVAVYAVLVIGAAYVTVNPTLPSERVAYSLERADVRTVLTLEWLGDNLEWPDSVELEFIEELARVPADEPIDLFEPRQRPDDLAYIIYTSGSTGRPKGVMIDHRGANNTCVDINHRFEITSDDRVLALAKFSFDLSVYDVFGVLGAGGAIVYAGHGAERDPERWARAIERHGVSVWNSVPALMSMLVDSQQGKAAGALRSLRVVMLSGDWIPLRLPPRIQVAAPEARLYSLGGATEASIWSIHHPIEAIEEDWTSVPYGVPLANQAFYVLDASLQPRPTWATGELYIGGDGLALGYVGDREQTEHRFIRHPETGVRLYRTGDLGCYRADGTIQFQGREDSQVKIRGFRIELGEIQSHLDQHPDVRASHVAVHRRGSTGAAAAQADDDACLIAAYVVLQDGVALDEDVLRDTLERALPEHMIPDRIVALDEIPLTPNGKVSARDLPALEVRSALATDAVPPETPLQMTIAKTWSAVLKLPVEAFGVDANFFDVGGTSLSVVRLAAELLDVTGVQLGVVELFEHSTVRKMATAIEAKTTPEAADDDGEGLRARAQRRAAMMRRRRGGR